MSGTIIIPKQEPRCERCGHVPGVHTTTSCANIYRTLIGGPIEQQASSWAQAAKLRVQNQPKAPK